jgi:oligopeptide transport system permease protein
MKVSFVTSLKLSWLWLGGLVGAALFVRVGLIANLGEINVENIFAPPSWLHWMGTDSMGRDFLVRILYGSGVSLVIAAQSIFLSIVLATFYGGAAGWLGHRRGWFLMMVLDVWMSLPASVLAALIALIVAQSSDSLLVVSCMIGATHWGRLARLVRGEVLRLREKDYIKASAALGASKLHILRFHLVPHLSAVMSIYIVYQIPNLILTESFLSFIGLGVQAPETSWGVLLQEGWRSLQVFPHVVLFPAGFLFLTVLSLNSIISKRNREPKLRLGNTRTAD